MDWEGERERKNNGLGEREKPTAANVRKRTTLIYYAHGGFINTDHDVLKTRYLILL